LTKMNEVIFDNVELETFSNYLLNKFAESVKEDDRMERFEIVISRLVWLRNNYCRELLEVIGLVSQVNTCICNVNDVRKVYILF